MATISRGSLKNADAKPDPVPDLRRNLFLSRPEIKDLLAYLRVLTNPEDDSAFLRIVNTPRRGIGPATIQKLGEWANTRDKSLYQASFDLGLGQTLSGQGLAALTNFTGWLAEVENWLSASR